jgi:hypothetical protein
MRGEFGLYAPRQLPLENARQPEPLQQQRTADENAGSGQQPVSERAARHSASSPDGAMI